MLSDAAANINDRPSSSGLIGQQVPGSGLAAPWQHAVQQGTSDDNASFAEAQTLRFAPAGAVASGLGHRYPSHGSDMSAHGVQQGTSLGAGDAQMRDLLMLVNKLGLRTSSNGTEHSMPQRSSHSNILPSGGMGPQLLSNPSSLPAPLQQQLQQLQQLHNLQRCQLSEMPNMSQAQPSQLQLAQQQLAQQQQQLSQQQQQLTQQQQLNQQQQQLTQQLQAQLGQADAETVMALMSSIGMGSTGQLLGNAQNGGLRSSSGLVLDGSSGLIMDGSGALASRRPMPLGGVGTLNCLSAGGLTNLNGSGNLSGRGLNNLSGSGLNNISGSGLVEERLSAGNMGGSSLPLGGSGVLQEPAAGLTNEQLLDAMQADPALLMNLLAAQQGGSGLHGAGGQAIGVQHAWQPVMDQRQVNWDALSMGAGAGGLANAGLAQHVPLVASMMPQQPQPAIASPLLQHQMLRSAHMQPQPLNLQQLGNTMTATYIAPRAQPMSAPQASHGVAQVSMGMAGMGTMAGLSMPAVSANNYVNLQLAGGGLAQQGVHLTLPHGSNSGALQAGQIANQQQVYWVQSAPMPNYIEVQVAQPQPQVQQLQAVDLLASARERLSSLVASVAAGSGQLRSSVPAAGTPAPSTPATGSGTISAPASSTAAATTATAPPAGDAPPPKLRSQHKLYKVRGKLYKNKTELCRNWLLGRNCRYGAKCQFAHGQWELQPKPEFREPPADPNAAADPSAAADADAGAEPSAAADTHADSKPLSAVESSGSDATLPSRTGADGAADAADTGTPDQSALSTQESALMSALTAAMATGDVMVAHVEPSILDDGVQAVEKEQTTVQETQKEADVQEAKEQAVVLERREEASCALAAEPAAPEATENVTGATAVEQLAADNAS